ncbi:MAG: CarD family transcriptional regulator [Lachnospiraceae bacterium]
MFEVGDYIIYGSNGVCKVEEIGKSNGSGIVKDKMYYTLVPEYSKGSKVFTPISNEKVSMRLIMSREEALNLIEEVENIEFLQVDEGKRREEVYKDALKNCDCREWVKIIKTLYSRKQIRMEEGKKVTAEDEKYLRKAEEILFGELAIPLKMTKDEVEKVIIHKLGF